MKKLEKRTSSTKLLTEATSGIGILDRKISGSLVTILLAMLTKEI